MDSQFDLASHGDALRPMGVQSGAKTVLLVCPTMWDECEIPHAATRARCRVLSFGTDVSEHPEEFDALDFIERAVTAVDGHDIGGVMASDDYPGSILAAVIARRLNLPGPDPGAVLRCQHKYYSRLAQRQAVPEAVPDFLLLDRAEIVPGDAGLRFPLFVKPVKSFFSIFAQEVADAAELREVARQASWHLREFIKPFDQLLRAHSEFPIGGGHLLLEAPLRGQQVTIEGCMYVSAR